MNLSVTTCALIDVYRLESWCGVHDMASENHTSLPNTTTLNTTWPPAIATSTLTTSTSSAFDGNSPTWDDATWILTSSFIIFTMQSGFGLLESGFAGCKNEVNVMAKNVADVIFGGISYWMFGYGLSFGSGPGTNAFCGVGRFFVNPDDDVMGEEYSRFVFQASFATTSTTIVSGAMAERTKFIAYIIFSFFNTFVYCFPAHWVWAKEGWLHKLHVVDVAGDGPVHLVGGTTALVAAVLIKPRLDRFTKDDSHRMGNPTNALLGTFILWYPIIQLGGLSIMYLYLLMVGLFYEMYNASIKCNEDRLEWGWLAFNCGSTYGISGGKWKIAARSAATTLMSASGGGVAAFTASFIVKKKVFEVSFIVSGILGALVSITAVCAVTGTWEALIIGAIGALLACSADALLHRLRIDDPVGAFPVHGVCGMWGLIACGLFAHEDNITMTYSKRNGLFWGGGFYLLGVQLLTVVALVGWTVVVACLFLKTIDLTVGLRLSPEDERLGADFVEHNIGAYRQLVEIDQEGVSSGNKVEPVTVENGVRIEPRVEHGHAFGHSDHGEIYTLSYRRSSHT